MASPSMVHRTGDTLVVRSVVSGDQLFKDGSETPANEPALPLDGLPEEELEDELDLPECKIKRNYICQHCNFFTQNPRSYLYHLKDVHKEKIKVYYTHIIKKNTNLYKTILNNLLKLNVSGEILPLSIVIFGEIGKKEKMKKKVVFANVSKTTLRN